MIENQNKKLLKDYVPTTRRAWWPWKWPTSKHDYTDKYVKNVRELCTSDLFFFCDEILRDQEDPHLDPHLHAEMAYVMQIPLSCGILVPRYHLKTTVCTVGYALWRLVKNCNTRILLKAATEDVAESFLDEIRQHILGNPRLNQLFPELIPMKGVGQKGFDTWNSSRIKIQRTRIYKDPSVRAVGAKTNLTGLHFDVAIYDDLMAEKNADTAETIQEVINNFEKDVFLLVANALRKMVGTRYDDGDLYGHSMKKRAFPFYVRQALEHCRPIWPNPDVMLKVKEDFKNCTPYVASCQLMNDPIPKETQEFRVEHLKRWDANIVRFNEWVSSAVDDDIKLYEQFYKSLDIFCGLDPARSDEALKINASSALVAIGLDQNGRQFLLEYRTEKGIGSTALIEIWVQFLKKWSKYGTLKRYGQEVIGGDMHLVEPTKKRLKELGLSVARLEQFKPSRNENKDDRIRELQIPWEHGLIFLHSSEHSEVEAQFLRFPRGRSRDIIDIWSHVHREFIGTKKKKVAAVTGKYEGWRNRYRKETKPWNWKTI